MRTSQRVAAVAVLGLPLLLASPTMALAGEKPHKPKCCKHIKAHQTQANNTEQENKNHSPVYQFNLGSGHHDANAVVKPELENENETWQDQSVGHDED
jgi:hypothetical protein